MVNEVQIKRLTKDWVAITKEEPIVNVIFVKGTFYAYASELAVLRLFKHYSGNYQGNKKVATGYSTNLKTWYFALETNL